MIPLMFLKKKKTSYKVFLLKLMNERANLSCFFVTNSLVNSRLLRANALVLIRSVKGPRPPSLHLVEIIRSDYLTKN